MKLEHFVAKLKQTHGTNLRSVILYGSAAGEDFQKKYSDYNVMIVLRELNPAELARSARLCRRWMGWLHKNPPPVFVDPEYLQNSRDVFPLEFLDIKEQHRILYGDDPFSDMNISTGHLRLQCESELKSKILGLREAFLLAYPNRRQVKNLVLHTSSSLFVLFRGFLRLLGEPIPPTKREVLARLNEKTHFDTAIFEKILAVREGKQKWPRRETLPWMEEYLTTLKKIARVVNTL